MRSQSEFRQIESRFFKQVVQLDPVRAGEMGLEPSAFQVPSGLPDLYEAQVRAFEEARDALNGLDSGELDEEQRLDRELIDNEACLLRLLQDRGRYQAAGEDPGLQVAEMLDGLFSREIFPPKVRAEAILSRLEGIPTFLEEARGRYTRPVRLWTQEALASAENTQDFLDQVATGVPALLGGKPGDLDHDPLCGAIAKGCQAGKQALAEFRHWLETEILPLPDHEFSLGPEVFPELVRLRRLGSDVAELQAMGQEKFQELGEAYTQAQADLFPGKTLTEAEAAWMDQVPPSFPEVLGLFRKAVASSREFVSQQLAIPLPGEERLEVRETPEFLHRVLPSAAYFDPPRFQKEQVGVYMVTPPAAGERLLEHAPAMIYNVSSHEGYPGHHLQLSWANRNPSLFRAWLSGDEFCEGWAHYCEEMMTEEGFAPVPGMAAAQLLDARFRALRILIDTGMQMGTVGFDEAVERLHVEGGISRARAQGEAGWYSYSPGYPLGYLTGKLLLQKIRRQRETSLGADFDLRSFHTAILEGGTMPIWAHQRRLSGPPKGNCLQGTSD